MSTVHTTNQLGKVHNLKVEGIVSFDGVPEDFNPEGSLSGSSEELSQRGKGGVRIHRNFCWKKNKTKPKAV